MKELRIWKTSQFLENFYKTKRTLIQNRDIPDTVMDVLNLTFTEDYPKGFNYLSGKYINLGQDIKTKNFEIYNKI